MFCFQSPFTRASRVLVSTTPLSSNKSNTPTNTILSTMNKFSCTSEYKRRGSEPTSESSGSSIRYIDHEPSMSDGSSTDTLPGIRADYLDIEPLSPGPDSLTSPSGVTVILNGTDGSNDQKILLDDNDQSSRSLSSSRSSSTRKFSNSSGTGTRWRRKLLLHLRSNSSSNPNNEEVCASSTSPSPISDSIGDDSRSSSRRRSGEEYNAENTTTLITNSSPSVLINFADAKQKSRSCRNMITASVNDIPSLENGFSEPDEEHENEGNGSNRELETENGSSLPSSPAVASTVGLTSSRVPYYDFLSVNNGAMRQETTSTSSPQLSSGTNLRSGVKSPPADTCGSFAGDSGLGIDTLKTESLDTLSCLPAARSCPNLERQSTAYSSINGPSSPSRSPGPAGPRFKPLEEGDIQVCYLNHTRTLVRKILSSKFLRRWEMHHLYLNDACLSSKTQECNFINIISISYWCRNMDLTMLSLLLIAITILVFYLINCYSYWSRRGIPSAKGVVPLLGHMLPVILLKENVPMVSEKVYNLYKNYSMVGFYKFTTPVLLIRDPELVKTVLQTNFASFHANGKTIDAKLDPLLAKNPFFCYGENWVAGRKRLTYAFSSMRLKILFESVKQVCAKFHGYIDKKLQANDKYEVELKPLLSKFTGEVVANAGLGIEGFCFEDNSDSKAFDAIGKSLFAPGVRTAIKQLLILVLPFMGKILGVKFVPDEIDNFFRNTIKSLLERRKKEPTQRNDFLQLMINLEKTEGEKLDVDTVTAHTFSFYVDGFETSSITLGFVIFQLATHLDIQKKLREEIMQELSKNDGMLTYEALREMTYMDQVISESQRCYSAVSSISKKCTEEFELKGSDGLTLRIKPGTEIEICIQALQQDPAYWTDPEVFDPDRFGPGRKNDIVKYTFLPFGEGPRMCVGMRMALLQMKACMATLLRYYKVELSSKTKVPLKLTGKSFLAAPEGGIWVNIKRI